MKEKRLKQTDIAKKTGINLKTFNSILHGKSPLRVDDLVNICENGLAISVTDFFGYWVKKEKI